MIIFLKLFFGFAILILLVWAMMDLDQKQFDQRQARCVELYGQGSVYEEQRYSKFCINPNGDIKGLR